MSSLIPSYLLKVTKLLGKISQFEFLVMTEKNIFAHKLFLSLNISDFDLFFMWKLQLPLEKVTPPISQQLPLKVEFLSSPPILKLWLEAQPPCRRGGAHYECMVFSYFCGLLPIEYLPKKEIAIIRRLFHFKFGQHQWLKGFSCV